MRKVELLSPAKDAQVGIEAFNHGADAVYIGSPRFSARSAAGNSVADIERLATYGHRYGARTFVALNTIMNDAELEEARLLAWQLYDAGVDALIVQDMGLLNIDMPPMELHGSTQMDNRTPEKALLLKQMGLSRVVLARELTLPQIAAIHQAVDVELECFVHGALCVCYSGQCYLSAALTGRSANRGECAQPCRLPMDLLDADGKVLVKNKHLLSLKDMNRSNYLEQMIEAGVTSLKIEGRLKDVSYVKNITAYYRRRLDALLAGHADWQAASDGRCTYTFTPRPAASFNRGFTSYFVQGGRDTEAGRTEPIWNMDTPKSMGEKIGLIRKIGKQSFMVRTLPSETEEMAVHNSTPNLTLHNGDGLFVKTKQGDFIGFRLNRNDEETHQLYPLGGAQILQQLQPGMELYRNLDYQFDQLLQKPSATRKVAVTLHLELTAQTISVTMTDEQNLTVQVSREAAFEAARTPQHDNYCKQLSKMGDTCFSASNISVHTDAETDYFVPSSLLSELRRLVCDSMERCRVQHYEEQRKSYQSAHPNMTISPSEIASILPNNYLANVMNHQAEAIYRQLGISNVSPAFELKKVENVPVMFTKHCLKYALGYCPKYQKSQDRLNEPLSLKIGDRKFVINFGCKNDCICEIFTTFANQNK